MADTKEIRLSDAVRMWKLSALLCYSMGKQVSAEKQAAFISMGDNLEAAAKEADDCLSAGFDPMIFIGEFGIANIGGAKELGLLTEDQIKGIKDFGLDS